MYGRRKNTYQSDTLVSCGECPESTPPIRYDSLKKHFKRIHPHIDVHIRNDGQPKRKQRKLFSFISKSELSNTVEGQCQINSNVLLFLIYVLYFDLKW